MYLFPCIWFAIHAVLQNGGEGFDDQLQNHVQFCESLVLYSCRKTPSWEDHTHVIHSWLPHVLLWWALLQWLLSPPSRAAFAGGCPRFGGMRWGHGERYLFRCWGEDGSFRLSLMPKEMCIFPGVWGHKFYEEGLPSQSVIGILILFLYTTFCILHSVSLIIIWNFNFFVIPFRILQFHSWSFFFLKK